MNAQFEDFQKLGKENFELALKSIDTQSKGLQAIATEVADYTKKSFEHSSAAAEKLFGVKTFDKAIEIQQTYVKEAYEGYVAYATKLGELVSSLAKDAAKPYEAIVAKVATVAK
ncbi:phasin family protein [Rhizobiales bacterium TNE-4]|nr:phasin family protein [Rhizobiales bacterium TNE-4]MBV1826653.1 phasin family protein [Rhizobiales bacterium TNE-4]